jgi:fluoride exporter
VAVINVFAYACVEIQRRPATMQLFLLASLGGALGAGVRYMVNVGAVRLLGTAFPWATLIVNVAGSAAMGFLLGFITLRLGGAVEWRTFLLTGILGGFTTFSAFSMDTAHLWDRGASGTALLYVLGSVMLSIAAFYLGAFAARHIL